MELKKLRATVISDFKYGGYVWPLLMRLLAINAVFRREVKD